ncbi:bifunctional 4-hydroxy-2-oxoglutarate aldolase/2-dehydro-3-deoxy-phosphogluconate aldolase [Pseudomonas sp. ABC1]|uniref:bifunctional 4-hydroxy-2-oxoglutarate aldolase/2-dehydro-3-deoxy-phosphogluconate aldolase n=1 Tax=Pseudomonas sp. ABC1 TaxID=2748080 RepID=UPI0015C3C848|nr:bifunctional 4-hydroxy-2-oxoglutarate aldolase/2-dehydro-3-deoxy-phosphogluconate aldolase [Pseudomonas sp. ABC1]QLF94983.1 bifunctional 4-hydroxy-2-oxoglutarate aldolase/2-dehydro-3-deoxy-phosphogluconate aldolase [Pseudomonas sp. ABC1]
MLNHMKGESLVSQEQKNARLDALCSRARILPVITITDERHILPLADALAAGGIETLEITLRSSHGLAAIRLLREQRPALCVGAGTVLDGQMLARVEDAGAQFIVSPGSTEELLLAARASPLPYLPGVSNASDIMRGYVLGYRRFKLFPAQVCGGVGALKALGGPFPDVRFCPTGGVNDDNVADYMALPNVMCVGGSWMIGPAALEAGDWSSITRAAARAVAAIGQVRAL